MKKILYFPISIPSILVSILLLGFMQTSKAQAPDVIDNLLKLTIEGNSYSDQTFILFIEGATPGFDSEFDAYKLMGIYAAPQFYSIISCCNLSINSLPDININHTVQMGFRVGANTNYTITAEELNTFGADTNVWLEDTQENLLIDLKLNPVYTFYGTEDDEETRFIVHFRYPVKLEITAFLEGPFNGSQHTIDLNTADFIPLDQPFNVEPWNYTGDESVVSIPTDQITDWVLIELRDATDAASANETTIVESQACFILSSGAVVGMDGTSNPEFKETIYENPYVVIHHRNHLSIMSAMPVALSEGVYPYDFSSGIDKAYGSGLAQKDLGGGVYGMIAGDGNADGTIDSSDKNTVWTMLVGKKGYLSSDYNLNGQISNQDKNDYWLINQTGSTQVP